MKIVPRQSILLIVSIAGAALATRLLLFLNPGVGGTRLLGFHVHHLLIGIILICIGGVPAVLIAPGERLLKAVSGVLFGIGVGLALDEWLLLILRESAPDTPYMSALSILGAVVLVGLVCGYAVLIDRYLVRHGGPSADGRS